MVVDFMSYVFILAYCRRKIPRPRPFGRIVVRWPFAFALKMESLIVEALDYVGRVVVYQCFRLRFCLLQSLDLINFGSMVLHLRNNGTGKCLPGRVMSPSPSIQMTG
jgi:hypothetical protein